MPAAGLDSLVERDAELSVLAAAAEQAAAGEGRLVVVEGPAGIGKTRLLRAVRADAAAAGKVRVLAARGTELEAHIAFGLVRQLLDPLVFALAEPERDELFTGAARLARTVLAEGVLGDDAPGGDRYSKINGLFWLVSTVARKEPLAVVVDDVQWADEPSFEFLCFLARRVEGLPVLLVAAIRPATESPGQLPAALVTDPGATVLRPAPLSPESVETLVRQTVGSYADEDFTDACLEATRGNPFLLSELLREVRARRLAPTAQAARRVGSLAPGGVSAAVELRLAQMPEGARALAEAVAVLGDHASPRSAARLAGVDSGSLGAAEATLVRAGILEGRDGLCFTHPVVRATVLHGISPTRRGGLHAAAAAMLSERGAEPEELATHLLHVEPAGDQRTVATLRSAAARASVLGAPATAAAYLDRALAEPPVGDQRCAVLTELGQAEARAGSGARRASAQGRRGGRRPGVARPSGAGASPRAQVRRRRGARARRPGDARARPRRAGPGAAGADRARARRTGVHQPGSARAPRGPHRGAARPGRGAADAARGVRARGTRLRRRRGRAEAGRGDRRPRGSRGRRRPHPRRRDGGRLRTPDRRRRDDVGGPARRRQPDQRPPARRGAAARIGGGPHGRRLHAGARQLAPRPHRRRRRGLLAGARSRRERTRDRRSRDRRARRQGAGGADPRRRRRRARPPPGRSPRSRRGPRRAPVPPRPPCPRSAADRAGRRRARHRRPPRVRPHQRRVGIRQPDHGPVALGRRAGAGPRGRARAGPAPGRRGARARRCVRRQARDRARAAGARARLRRRDHAANAGTGGRDSHRLAGGPRRRRRHDRPRRRAAPCRQALGGARERDPRPGAGDELRRHAARAPGPRGGARRRCAAAPDRQPRRRLAHAGRAPRRPARGRGAHQPRDRGGPLRDDQDGRDAPRERVREARNPVADAASGRARLRRRSAGAVRAHASVALKAAIAAAHSSPARVTRSLCPAPSTMCSRFGSGAASY